MCGSRNFHQAGGGGVEGPGPPDSKKLRLRCFVIFAVFCPYLQLKLTVLQRGLMVYFLENNTEGVQHFTGWGEGVQLFSRGGGGRSNANFHRNLSKL